MVKRDAPQFDPTTYDTFAHSWAKARGRVDPDVEDLWRAVQALVKDAAKAQTPFTAQRPLRVLDVGCGAGRYTFHLEDRLRAARIPYRMIGCDVSRELLKIGQADAAQRESSVTFEYGDQADLPYPDGSADVILSRGAFHHLLTDAEHQRAAREFHRVLAPRGLLFMAVWYGMGNDPNLRLKRGTFPLLIVPWRDPTGKTYDRWYYFFDQDELRALFTKNRFQIEDVFLQSKRGKRDDATRAVNIILIAHKN